jgi:hypothetical protein
MACKSAVTDTRQDDGCVALSFVHVLTGNAVKAADAVNAHQRSLQHRGKCLLWALKAPATAL